MHHCTSTNLKVHPPHPFVPNVAREHFYRASEENARLGQRRPLWKLTSIAAKRARDGARVAAVGRNVLNLEFAVATTASKFKVPGVSGGVHIDDLLPTKRVAFGPLSLPLPRRPRTVLFNLYPSSSTQYSCMVVRRYQKPRGGWADVPEDIARCVEPSTTF